MNGFQAGVSFTPDADSDAVQQGVGYDDAADTAGKQYDLGVRYEGQFQNVGVIAGAGYSHQELETATAGVAAGSPSDDRQSWNVGLDLDIGAFGIGAAYLNDDHGETEIAASTATIDDEQTFVIGADYTTGPFKFGLSYLDGDNVANVQDLEAKRYTGGVVYTYGPGMTFRGSISHLKLEDTDIGGTGDNEISGTAVLLGTQIKF